MTERGIDYLKAGDYGKGIATLRLALQRDPTDAAALFNLAMALSDQGALDESVELLERMLKDYPSHAHGWVALGVAHARQKNDASAIEALRMAVGLNPQDGYSHKNLGAILSKSGYRTESIKHLRRATELLPTDPAAWLNLGLTLADADELEEADEAYLQVLSLDPSGQLGQRAEKGRSQIDSSPPHGSSPCGHGTCVPVQTTYKPSVVLRRRLSASGAGTSGRMPFPTASGRFNGSRGWRSRRSRRSPSRSRCSAPVASM